MQDTETELKTLQSEIQKKQAVFAKAEVARENAESGIKSVLASLEEEFGIKNPSEIQAKVEELQAEYEAEVQKVRDSLAEAGE